MLVIQTLKVVSNSFQLKKRILDQRKKKKGKERNKQNREKRKSFYQ